MVSYSSLLHFNITTSFDSLTYQLMYQERKIKSQKRPGKANTKKSNIQLIQLKARLEKDANNIEIEIVLTSKCRCA